MKARVTASELHRATAWTSKTAGGAGAVLPVLAGVLLEAEDARGGGRINVTSYNVQNVAATSVSCAVTEPGRVVVPQTLVGVLAGMGDRAVDLSVERDRLHATSQDRNAEVALMAVEDYPDIPRRTEASSKAEGLAAALAQVLPAVDSGKGAKVILQGVTMQAEGETLHLYASDENFLLSASLPWEGPPLRVVVPTSGAQAASRMAEPLVLYADDRLAWFSDGETELASQLIEGTPPTFSAFLARPDAIVSVMDVAVADLIDALQYASQIRSQADLPFVWVDATPDGLAITSAAGRDKGATQASCEAALSGAPIRFTVNATNLAHCLRALRSPDARIEMAHHNKLFYLSRPGEQPVAACMPVRS